VGSSPLAGCINNDSSDTGDVNTKLTRARRQSV